MTDLFWCQNATASSPPSPEVSATPVAPPATPTGLTATPGNAQVTLSWSGVTGAATYKVQRSTTNGSGYADFAGNITTAPTVTLTNTGLANATTYYYVVTATNAGGNSPYSTQASATPVALLTAPTGLTATPGNGKVTLSWSAVTGAVTYKVQRTTTSGTGYADFAGNTTTVPTVTLIDTGLINGNAYYYIITASNASGTSPMSGEIYVVLVIPTGIGPDTDNDGLLDAWEVFYFGNLNQTGMGDFDGDLKTNSEEFLAGTDPTISYVNPNDHVSPTITLTIPVTAVPIP